MNIVKCKYKLKRMKRILFLCIVLFGTVSLSGQSVAVKTNLLYDLSLSPNLGVEIGLTNKNTLHLSASYNPFELGDNKKLKHWLIEPELRYWLCEKFMGHFLGVHAIAGGFNAGGIKLLGMEKYRYEGLAFGGGVSYGYQWVLGKRWNLEASIGLGYVNLKYDKFYCEKCGEKIGEESTHFVGPTRAAVSLIYIIK